MLFFSDLLPKILHWCTQAESLISVSFHLRLTEQWKQIKECTWNWQLFYAFESISTMSHRKLVLIVPIQRVTLSAKIVFLQNISKITGKSFSVRWPIWFHIIYSKAQLCWFPIIFYISTQKDSELTIMHQH